MGTHGTTPFFREKFAHISRDENLRFSMGLVGSKGTSTGPPKKSVYKFVTRVVAPVNRVITLLLAGFWAHKTQVSVSFTATARFISPVGFNLESTSVQATLGCWNGLGRGIAYSNTWMFREVSQWLVNGL